MIRILSLMLVLTACKKAPPAAGFSAKDNESLVGLWKSDGGMVAIIKDPGLAAEVTSLIDYDDEVFVILSSGWEKQGFSMHYEVPSTEYLVTILITEIADEQLLFDWNNTAPDGTRNNGAGYFDRLE